MNRDRIIGFAGLLSLLAVAGCASGPVELPEPRPLVLRSGARLMVDDQERLQTIYEEFRRETDNIVNDPSFFIDAHPEPTASFPWETLEISHDTALVAYQRTAEDVSGSYAAYAHLHLMKVMGRLDEWLPEAADAEGFELESAIVKRTAEYWLLGRALFGMAPNDLMDELVYAMEGDQLDPLLLTLRADEFPAERAKWLEENPGADEAFGAWYRETFAEDPPEPRGGGARP